MKIDSTITISIVLAICALFAPSLTAIINNKHQYKMRKLELFHDEQLRNYDTLYRNKYDVYKRFVENASHYSRFNDYAKEFTNTLSCIHAALLVCDSETGQLLLKFQQYVENHSSSNCDEYIELITSLTESFNRELSSLSRAYND